MRTGIILALMAALFWALGDIFMRYALKSVQVLPVTLLSLVAGMAGFYIYLIARGRVGEVARMPRHDKLMYVCHGLVSFGLGYYLFYYAIQNVGVTRAAVITAGWPLVAFFIGLSLYGEKLSRTKAIGVALIMLSVFLAIE
jgi:drug/metabolite transporter (DMT)-like permease